MVFRKLRETCSFDLTKYGPIPMSWGRVMFKKLKSLTTIKATRLKWKQRQTERKRETDRTEAET